MVNAITNSAIGLRNIIITPITVSNPISGEELKSHGIWDTGATNSVITEESAKALGLTPITFVNVNGVHGSKIVPVYALKLVLNNENVIFHLQVTEGSKLLDGGEAAMLIGMDVINRGDFSISNFQGNTVMSYRTPSILRTDFVEEIKSTQPTIKKKTPGRNDPCSCGSGKKFKNCCLN